jgi:dTDP-4-amino-4,6-dideoxygalactose transaminase
VLDRGHARHLYTIRIDPARFTVNRTQFVKALAAENIGTGIHFVPVHVHRYYAERFGYRRGDCPEAELIGDRTISLPLSAGMSEADASDVIAAVRKVAGRYLRRRETVAAARPIAASARGVDA